MAGAQIVCRGELFEAQDPLTTAGQVDPRPVGDGADFIDIVTFDKLAAVCSEYLTKGREVAVVGKLRLPEWTRRDGERRSKAQVVADAVQFLGSPRKAADRDGGVAEPADKPAIGSYWRNAR